MYYSSELLTFLMRLCYVWCGLLRIILVEVLVDFVAHAQNLNT